MSGAENRTDFLLELRSEEIPARMQAGARAELEKLFRREMTAAGVAPGEITVWSTPRRLALIARDEGMHRDLGVCIYNNYCARLPAEDVYAIVREGVRVEQEFVRTALRDGLLGLTTESMCRYVEFVADHLLSALDGVDKIYNTPNPLDFMELISLQGKTNFFEKRVGEYAKTNVSADDTPVDRVLNFNADADF